MSSINITPKVGDYVKLTRPIMLAYAYFEKDSIVKIVGIGPRGYNLEDDAGNRVCEVNGLSVEPVPCINVLYSYKHFTGDAIEKIEEAISVIDNYNYNQDVNEEAIKNLKDAIELLHKARRNAHFAVPPGDIIKMKKEN